MWHVLVKPVTISYTGNSFNKVTKWTYVNVFKKMMKNVNMHKPILINTLGNDYYEGGSGKWKAFYFSG